MRIIVRRRVYSRGAPTMSAAGVFARPICHERRAGPKRTGYIS